MEFTITITAEPDFNGRTFWAHEWGFIGKREGGYLGLQSRNGNMKAVNFSIWGLSVGKRLKVPIVDFSLTKVLEYNVM